MLGFDDQRASEPGWSAGRKIGITGFSPPGATTKIPDYRAIQIYRPMV
jgi:hypothetical protein